jgi:ABC-type nickel/cobalt efflux system permease component RcnA
MQSELGGLAPWANLTALGALITVVVWMMTKGFPQLIERTDKVLERKDLESVNERHEFMAALQAERDHRDAARREHTAALKAVKDADGESHKVLADQVQLTRDVLLRLSTRLEDLPCKYLGSGGVDCAEGGGRDG